MRFDLVAMPWLRPDFPSMALSRLRSVLTAAGHAGADHYSNLRWLEWMVGVGGIGGGRLYTAIVDGSMRFDVGSWVFAREYWRGVAGGNDADAEYLEELERSSDMPIGELVELSDGVRSFCDSEAERILDGRPDLIGFTTTFQQTYPALALARAIKERRPDVPVVFGGANCDGEMGPGLLDAFPEIDFTVTGEAERAVIELAELVLGRREPDGIAGLSWRAGDGVRTSPARGEPVDLDELPSPDHGAYFEQFESTGLASVIAQPGVVVETSRGCWWGEKKHCTFCGLNGDTMTFRSESGSRAVEQIVGAVRRHRTPNVAVVDNIMDRAYFDDALPALASLDADLLIFYEIRSDLSADEVRALAAAGIRIVQPGIESLGTTPLRLMRKSSTGAKQVQVLRDLHTEDVSVTWNYLYGFPGEDWERDYAPIVAQMRNLVHLSAPDTARIDLQRFSPNFNDPSLGFRPIELPPSAHSIHRGLDTEQMERIVYRFVTRQQGVTERDVQPLRSAIADWQELFRSSSLRWRSTPEGVLIQDRRANRPPADHLLDAEESQLHDLLQTPLSLAAIHAGLERRDVSMTDAQLEGRLGVLFEAGLVFTEGGRWVAVANEGRRPVGPSARPARRRLEVSTR